MSEHVRVRTANGRVVVSLTPEAASVIQAGLAALRDGYRRLPDEPGLSRAAAGRLRVLWLAYIDDMGEALQAARDEVGDPATCECPTCVVERAEAGR